MGAKKQQQKKKSPAAMAIALVVCLVLIVVVIWLVRVVVINGAALLKGVGDTPISVPDDEEVWVSPTVEAGETWDVGDVVPEYVPDVQQNDDFDQTEQGADSVPVDAVPEDLIGTTVEPNPTQELLFDPADAGEGD